MSAMGRPPKYKREYCDELPELMKDGLSVCEVCAKWGISKEAFFLWMREDPKKPGQPKHPEFARAYALARTLCQAWWEKAGRIGLYSQSVTEYDEDGNKIKTTTRDINEKIWTRNMVNRFRDDWTEKVEVEHSGSITAPTLELVLQGAQPAPEEPKP